ncbi:hypothetical protein NXH76_20365 [Blautia schinkii]|nr:hypothetical protein [Blautia schinkii]
MKNAHKYGRKIFAVIFICVLLGYSAMNFLNCSDTLRKSVEDFEQLESRQYIEEINTVVEENILFRYGIVEAYGAIQMAMGKKEENSFHNVKDKSGYLFSGNFWAGHGENQKTLAVRMRRLMEKMKTKGTKVAFILNPEKTVREGMEYPGIPYDNYEKEADDIVRWLDYYSVPYLDLRDTMEKWDMS